MDALLSSPKTSSQHSASATDAPSVTSTIEIKNLVEIEHEVEREMHILSFILSPEGVGRVHDAVLCLAKFSEMVSLEARSDKVRMLFRYLRRSGTDVPAR